jgi:hypothetical protein
MKSFIVAFLIVASAATTVDEHDSPIPVGPLKTIERLPYGLTLEHNSPIPVGPLKTIEQLPYGFSLATDRINHVRCMADDPFDFTVIWAHGTWPRRMLAKLLQHLEMSGAVEWIKDAHKEREFPPHMGDVDGWDEFRFKFNRKQAFAGFLDEEDEQQQKKQKTREEMEASGDWTDFDPGFVCRGKEL